MSGNEPVASTYEEVARILRNMAEHVAAGDSFEGSIEYSMPEMPRIQDPAAAEQLPEVMVRAAYRIGNTMGQGGMRIVGSMNR